MEILKTFEQGEIIFKQGDIGEAMLMIKEGSVEVFKETPQGEVLLTVQGPGEAIGMLTFFTGTQRLASARARTPVEGQLICRVAGQDPLAKLPKWVQIVLKEFATRLDQINDQFARAQQSQHELMNRAVDSVFISIQVASCLAAIGPFKARKGAEGRDVIILSDLMETISLCLGYDKRDMERTLEVFKATGILAAERDKDLGKECIALQGVQKLRWYVDFAQSARAGKNRRLVQSPFPPKQRKQLLALRDYVHKTGADPNKPYSTELSVLIEQYSRLMGTPIDTPAIEAAEKLELIEVKRNADKVTLTFHPSELHRTLIAAHTLRRLRSEPGSENPEEPT